MKNKLLMLAGAMTMMTGLSGCVSSIGQEDFTCPNLKKGGVCGGPRDVYELTNNRINLENLTQEELDAHRENKAMQSSGPSGSVQYLGEDAIADNQRHDDTVVYEPRGTGQQSPDNYQRAEALPQSRFNSGQRDEYDGWPSYEEPLAPEPLAILEPAQVMRVLVAAYTDNTGYLHMPGYTYVEVTPRRWAYGDAANERPTRVVPLQIQRRSQQQQQRNHQRAQGVDPMEVINPANRTQ
jgi:conjugal transfer pilus assembly protein TraV